MTILSKEEVEALKVARNLCRTTEFVEGCKKLIAESEARAIKLAEYRVYKRV